jgi:hypothetical protein
VLTEAGVVNALRDIYNYYHEVVGGSYIRTAAYEKCGAFLVPRKSILVPASHHGGSRE